ncbi:hypothetical protein ACFWNQ_13915 [Streptomyces virginiae]|uniref:hypothetical protein n=1 Tax=Streptomyces virginiae TaxID=1961 RepID=UPI00365F55E9
MSIQYDSGSQSGFHSLDDLRHYSRITSDGLQAYRLSQLGQLRQRAARAAGLDHAGAFRSSRGDGEQTVWPTGTTPYAMLSTYPLALHEELRQLNGAGGDTSVQLRLAVVDGYSEAVAGGRVGLPPVLLTRLADSKACRMGLTALPKAYVSLIVDDTTYQRVVARDAAGDRSRFVEVLVDDPDKEFQERAWVTVPGATPSDLEQLTAELEAAALTPASAAPRAPRRAPGPSFEERTPAPTPLNHRTVGDSPAGGAPHLRMPQRQAGHRTDSDHDDDDPPGEPESGTVDQDAHNRPGPGPWVQFFSPIVVAAVVGVFAILAATVPLLLADDGGGKDDKKTGVPSSSQPAGGDATTPTASGSSGPAATGSGLADPVPPGGRTVQETAANRNGTPVFADARGATAAKERIPYATTVPVSCWTENASGMASVNAFYLIADGPWKGLFAPANTFANGDPLGTQGGSHDIDPKVAKCEA